MNVSKKSEFWPNPDSLGVNALSTINCSKTIHEFPLCSTRYKTQNFKNFLRYYALILGFVAGTTNGGFR